MLVVMVVLSITLSSASAARSLAETLATSSQTPLPVLDVNGKVVRSGSNYYVLPAVSGEGGGVALASLTKDSESCPQTVVQDQDEISQGIQLTFGPVNSKSGYTVRTFTDLNVRFVADTPCEEGTVWKVEDYDDDVQQWFLGTGGVEGNPGPRTVKNWFKIWKAQRRERGAATGAGRGDWLGDWRGDGSEVNDGRGDAERGAATGSATGSARGSGLHAEEEESKELTEEER
ncbi:unnamed protein product [Linum tenue]|uniref:Uncharacterized protein n=1 Tax=Linum tenue TaxID=586396 RepID=A0AAV0QI74_9ROSI|nr:unnamed protein product [Linum tenue]